MDRYLNLLPYGVSGELCIGGQGVGRGYLNNPELTSERFINYKLQNTKYKQTTNYNVQNYKPDAIHAIIHPCNIIPIFPFPHSPIDRSGDLARRLPGGDLEYLGRIDQQVKIRGHRIELGEIESQLLKHPNVKEVLVIVKEDKNGDKYLYGYIVPTSNNTFNASELREYLSGKLPEYMIPLYFISLAKFPLTPNGKIDRKTLPAPGIKPDNYIAPQDKLEKKLVGIWAQVLEINPDLIGIDTNFFQLGSHSLKAASVISGIYDELAIRVPLIEVFRTPTVRQLAQYIKYEEGKTTPITDKDLILLKKSTDNAGHLFFIHVGTGDVEGYIEFCKELNIEVHCWGIRAAPLENYMPVNLSIESMALNYIKTLQKVQPHGPYSIAGWSLGGVIAFEMALQLETMGQKTTFLGLIDAPCPQMDGNDDFIPFSLQTEVSLIINSMPNSKIKKRIKNISDVNEVLPALIDFMEENNIGVNTIKRLIPDDLSRIIPKFNRVDTRDLTYYLNMHRTLTNALRRYLPGSPIDMTINYFKASQSPEAVKKGWHDYCKKSLEIHQLEGDHFSILRKPVVNRLGKIFTAVFTAPGPGNY